MATVVGKIKNLNENGVSKVKKADFFFREKKHSFLNQFFFVSIDLKIFKFIMPEKKI